MTKLTAEQLADKWIKELEKAGFTPDQMLEVFRMAREKYKQLKAKNSATPRTQNFELETLN